MLNIKINVIILNVQFKKQVVYEFLYISSIYPYINKQLIFFSNMLAWIAKIILNRRNETKLWNKN